MQIEVLIAVLTSAAVFGFIQFLITRHDSKNGFMAEIRRDIETIKDDILSLKDGRGRDKADDARRRILAASDDVRNNRTKHSKEWWDQLNADITNYERYCAVHEDYENNRAMMAINNLNDIYQKLLKEGFE